MAKRVHRGEVVARKLTTVDHLARLFHEYDMNMGKSQFRKFLAESKEHERELLLDAWNDGYEKGRRSRLEKIDNPVFDAEHYYSEMYVEKRLEDEKEFDTSDMIRFAFWLRENDTMENGERWFGYTNQDMLKEWVRTEKSEEF